MKLRMFLAVIALLALTITGTATSAMAATSPSTVKFGDRGSSVSDLQRKLGMRPNGVFGKDTLDAVVARQYGTGLVVDGIVGPLTWSYVNNPTQAVTGQSFTATGAKRVVADKKNNLVFLIDGAGQLVRSMRMIDSDTLTTAGSFRTSQELALNYNATASGEAGNLKLYNFTRVNGGIGFHAIPINKVTEVPLHKASALGAGTRLKSLGCMRLEPSNARFLQDWLPLRSSVIVVDRITTKI